MQAQKFDQQRPAARPGPAPRRMIGAVIAMLIVLAGALFISAWPAYAAAITAYGTTCTLIDAITAANTDTATGGCPAGSGADTITLTADVTLPAVNNGTPFDTGPNGLPQVTSAITIEGEGHTIARSTVSGVPSFRPLYVASSGNLTLNRVTVTGGTGGAITNNGTLTINNSTLSGNSSGSGGAIFVAGTTTLQRSLISGNSASSGAELFKQNGAINANNANLFGESSKTNAQAFSGFTPGATDITATSNGTTPTALASILNPTLADNGGAWTHALVAGSPALDAAGDSGLDTDQRGVTRPQGSADDIGAFELAVNTTPGAALDFDGSNDYVELPALELNSNRVTFEAWIYPDGGQADYTTLLKAGAGHGVTILWLPGGQLGYQWDGAYWNVASGLTIPLNAWSHIAVAVEPDKAKLYLNGVAFTNTGTHVVKPFDVPIQLGTDLDNGGRAFKGRMDEVRIWNRTLTASELQRRQNCELGSTPADLAARYNFNQGGAAAANSSVITLTDGSGNGKDGTLTNFTLSGDSSNWVAPGSTASGVACPTQPTLTLQGNGATITSGDSTPSSTDNTDFGLVAVSATASKAFTLRNTGDAALTISAITFTGNAAAEYTLVSPPSFPLTLTPNGSQAITVQLQPTVASQRRATLTIASNDPATPSYTAVLGGGAPPVGAALDFDGSDYVTLPAALNSQLNTGQITVEGWFYPTARSGDAIMLAEEYPSTDNNVSFTLYHNNTTISCGFYGGGWNVAVAPDLTLNSWQHLACTYDGQAISLYRNGLLLISQSTGAGLPGGAGAWYLGRRWDGAVSYQGQMDEVRIWNRAKAASELTADLNCELGSNPAGLVARYNFNQGWPWRITPM